MRDEAEIRGHRRTYIGALPGTIIRALRDAGSKNPVFMIDEIDKMGADWRGDPGERDARGARPRAELDLPRPLPRPAVRPLEGALHLHREPARDDPAAAPATGWTMIQLSGYTEEEKLGIAKRYLVPKQLEAHGLDAASTSSSRTRRSGTIIARVHARGRRPQPRARDRRRLPQGRRRDRLRETEDRRGRTSAACVR